MKTVIANIVLVLAVNFAVAQSQETRSLSSFSEISVSEAIDVQLKAGSTEEVRVVSQSHDLDEVLTEVSGDRLKIHLEGNNHNNVKVTVYVTYKTLERVQASSAASITSTKTVDARGKDFRVDVSSAADVTMDIENADELNVDASSAGDANLTVKVNEVEAEATSASDINISGTAKRQDIQVSSSGDYRGYDMESDEVKAKASSGGSIKVTVNERIYGNASSGGTVRYKGNPKYVNSDSSSGGSVKKS